MPRYSVNAPVIGGKHIGVFEAENEKDAISKAECSESAYVSFCHQCSRECENAEIDWDKATAQEEK